jgi:hypothetical protein
MRKRGAKDRLIDLRALGLISTPREGSASSSDRLRPLHRAKSHSRYNPAVRRCSSSAIKCDALKSRKTGGEFTTETHEGKRVQPFLYKGLR